MRRSLAAIGSDWDAQLLREIVELLLARSNLTDALIYGQVTRGTPDLATMPARTHAAPAGIKPTVFAFARPFAAMDWANAVPPTKKCVTQRDIRWSRCDIKSTSLLGHLMCTTAAVRGGCDEAILIHGDGPEAIVTEGSHCNMALVTRDGEIVTPSLDSASMLAGVTRELLLRAEPGIQQRKVFARELDDAREIMLIGTTTMVSSVTHLDGREINNGQIGPVARRLCRSLTDACAMSG